MFRRRPGQPAGAADHIHSAAIGVLAMTETNPARRHPSLLILTLVTLLLGTLVPASAAAAGRSAQAPGSVTARGASADFEPTAANKKECKKKKSQVRKRTYKKQVRKQTKSVGKCDKACRKQAKKAARSKAKKKYERCIGYDTCTQDAVTFDSAMVPTCGVVWGVIANAFGTRPGWPEQGPESHRRFEAEFGREFGLYSQYLLRRHALPPPARHHAGP